VNSNIKPQDYCFPRIKMYIDKYSKWTLIFCVSLGVILAIIFMSSGCLFKHPGKKFKVVYRKFDYTQIFK
jgi:uncharacterized membrane protein